MGRHKYRVPRYSLKRPRNISLWESLKRWWKCGGWMLFSFEVIGALIVAIIFIYCLYHAKRSDEFAFRGINPNEVEKARKIPIRGLKSANDSEKGKKRWKREGMCREIIERIYGRKFPSVRPNFLKSPVTGNNLELDCYNADLKIALEHDGPQHAQYTPYFHRRGVSDFTYQVVKDDWKTQRCKQEGILLIRVPQWVPELNLEKYIVNKLRGAKKLPTWYAMF